MMNVDKKKFNEHLHCLETIIRNRNYSICQTPQLPSMNHHLLPEEQLSAYQSPSSIIEQAHESINLTEVKNILVSSLLKNQRASYKSNPKANEKILEELLMILFNDLRVPINCRKNIVVEEINFGEVGENWQEDIVKVINNIREECEYTYNERFKNVSESLI